MVNVFISHTLLCLLYNIILRNSDVESYFKAKAGLTLLQDMCIQADSHFGRGEVKHLLYRYPDTVGEWLPVDIIYVLW